MVRVEHLFFDYRVGKDRFPILRDIDFSLPRGEVLCLIGPSGCGKTTLLFNIAGLRAPDSGAVYIDGEAIARPRAKTSIIFQHFGLLPWKNVFENVALGLRIRGVGETSIRKTVEFSLGHFGMGHLAGKYPKHLSGGEKQRVAIARALVLRPDLLLLDEPFSAIDALTRESLQEFLVTVWKDWNLTIIHVTHDIEEAVFLGTQILVFGKDGTIRQRYAVPGEKGATFRDSPSFFEATASLRAYMLGVIDENPV